MAFPTTTGLLLTLYAFPTFKETLPLAYKPRPYTLPLKTTHLQKLCLNNYKLFAPVDFIDTILVQCTRLTHVVVHRDKSHLFQNLLSLFLTAPFVESQVGSLFTLATFTSASLLNSFTITKPTTSDINLSSPNISLPSLHANYEKDLVKQGMELIGDLLENVGGEVGGAVNRSFGSSPISYFGAAAGISSLIGLDFCFSCTKLFKSVKLKRKRKLKELNSIPSFYTSGKKQSAVGLVRENIILFLEGLKLGSIIIRMSSEALKWSKSTDAPWDAILFQSRVENQANCVGFIFGVCAFFTFKIYKYIRKNFILF
eukprot:snap_masked-scaffold_3-processed-gene-14.38-mRNA-1 protein AED:1.00 eAED:1.00 QI:0/-1/0/0/-1/1/1/0/312